ncbi:MAG: rhodanese-like domain-containing protein, partial [Candidatus Eisenbacteria bacterium]|nr:rhodanese-like domain-containing protein [Candidatus Eisenbacteria bacterium]
MSAHRAVAGARGLVAGAVLAAALAAGAARAEAPPTTIDHATLGDTESRTPEISTADLTDVIARGSAAVIDTRSFAEYAISHIPGAISVAERPGLAKARSASDVGEIDRVLGGRRDTAIVLYGNGPFDGSTRRIADHLAVAGYTNVRRYQLGIPV